MSQSEWANERLWEFLEPKPLSKSGKGIEQEGGEMSELRDEVAKEICNMSGWDSRGGEALSKDIADSILALPQLQELREKASEWDSLGKFFNLSLAKEWKEKAELLEKYLKASGEG